jgi:hypothetical protein
MVMPGDNIAIVVELIVPIAMEEKLRFAIREGGRTVGAGVVAWKNLKAAGIPVYFAVQFYEVGARGRRRQSPVRVLGSRVPKPPADCNERGSLVALAV